jgi:thymidylate synthase
MYLPVPTQPSCARAWVAASLDVIARGDEAYNVILDVDDAFVHDEADNAAISHVNRFLVARDQNPIITVANTIFPQSLYTAHGAPTFYEIYLRDYDKLTETKRWGRYFERMTRHRTLQGGIYNPLDYLVDKIRRQNKRARFKSAYELAVYDPLKDGRMLRGSQCLSFVSFKLHPERGLTLTALYRNHTYITRCLGNLIGLGRLQAFVAKEAGVDRGPLTCVSTHAEIDTGTGWGLQDARRLVTEAAAIIARSEELVPAPVG